MTPPSTKTGLEVELAKIATWWRTALQEDRTFLGDRMFAIADTEHDQPVPAGISNPFWQIIRNLPSLHDPRDGVVPYPYPMGLGIGRDQLARRYSWAIPTPGDMRWLVNVLNGRPLVEAAAGSGYWAWQAAQVGIDVTAYEPCRPDNNPFVEGREYFPLRRADAVTAASRHPDRALLISWPSYSEPWAAETLRAYQGDLFIYAGEPEGGCCADDAFFELLDREWVEVGESTHHRTWWGIHCRLIAYRRRTVTS